MQIPMKTYPPSLLHIECMARLKAALDPALTPPEMLALVSQLVGNLIALQDQRVMTPAIAMAIVQANIEVGNREAIANVASAGGTPN